MAAGVESPLPQGPSGIGVPLMLVSPRLRLIVLFLSGRAEVVLAHRVSERLTSCTLSRFVDY